MVPAIPANLRAKSVVAGSKALWQAEKKHARQLGRGPCLERVLWKVCRRSVLIGSFFGCINGFVATAVRPLLLRALVSSLTTTSEAWNLYTWAGALCLALLVEGIAQSAACHVIVARLGVRFNSTFVGLALAHSLQLATCHAHSQDAPDAGNLVGNDAVRLQQGLFILCSMPGAFASLVGGITILVYTLGVAGALGLASMMIMLCLNIQISSLAQRAEKQNLMRTDRRMRVMTQVVHGIRAIKFCAWEESFQTMLTKERASECVPLKWYQVLTQTTVQIGRANPVVGCLFAFLVLAIAARDDPESFKPSDIFTALNVFLALRSSLVTLPEGLICIATSRVAIRRLQHFLLVPEALCHWGRNATENPDQDLCIRVEQAIFKWPAKVGDASRKANMPSCPPSPDRSTKHSTGSLAPGSELLLQSLEVPKGFTAVVGSVGSGKSSLVAALLGEMPRSDAAESADSAVELRGQRLAFIPQKAFETLTPEHPSKSL